MSIKFAYFMVQQFIVLYIMYVIFFPQKEDSPNNRHLGASVSDFFSLKKSLFIF